MQNMHNDLNLVKIKHGSPFVRFKPWLAHAASLEQMKVELKDVARDANEKAGRDYLFFTRLGKTLRYEVKKW